jgi:hypothetical protein
MCVDEVQATLAAGGSAGLDELPYSSAVVPGSCGTRSRRVQNSSATVLLGLAPVSSLDPPGSTPPLVVAET